MYGLKSRQEIVELLMNIVGRNTDATRKNSEFTVRRVCVCVCVCVCSEVYLPVPSVDTTPSPLSPLKLAACLPSWPDKELAIPTAYKSLWVCTIK